MKRYVKKWMSILLLWVLVVVIAVPAYAVENQIHVVAQAEGVSLETAISNIKGTIETIKANMMNGKIANKAMEDLAVQLSELEKMVTADNVTQDVIDVLGDAQGVADMIDSDSSIKVKAILEVIKSKLNVDVSVTPQSQAANIAFGDIEGHWAKDDIMAMCEGENPLFKGTGDVNGVPQFSPDKTMTGHEFVTVICRAMYPNEIKALQNGESWWAPTYRVATSHGLVSDDAESLKDPISRQKMAKIMAKVLKQKGEDTSKLVSPSKIPDYNNIGEFYQHDVRVVYSLGIIQGTDGSGNFNPTMTVTRAQGATILCRLLDPSCRKAVDFSTTQTPTTGPQEFKEGEPHAIPKAGDVVIKADGTRVTLTETVVGHNNSTGKDITVLGFQQGVDYVTGTNYLSGWYKNDMTPFTKCERTGEIFTMAQWDAISSYTGKNLENITGDYDGEIYNMYWQWSADMQEWLWVGGDVA